MRGRAASCVFLLLLSGLAEAQVIVQPAAPPRVTADAESWYTTGSPIAWGGDLYDPIGTPRAFNGDEMLRAGSYLGIPVYIDPALEPRAVVLVPLSGGRVQPYERRQTPETAATVVLTPEGYLQRGPAAPTFTRPDVGPAEILQPISPAAPIVVLRPGAVATTGTRAAPQAVGTTGRVPTIVNSAVKPKGINGAWIEYDGRRWVSAGKAIDLDGDFTEVGRYKGSPVYRRHGDSLTIYIPTTTDLVAPFKPKGL